VDANKLKVLQAIDYKIQPHCGICVHADLSPDGWGYCNTHTYSHLKHSEGESRLSVHRAGSCEPILLDKESGDVLVRGFELDHGKVGALGLHAFAEFLPNPA